MSETQENKNKEVKLTAPKMLNDEDFKTLLKNDLKTNNQDYLADVASRHNLNLRENEDAVLEIAYDEQLDAIAQNCITDALDENTSASYFLLQKLCYFDENDYAYIAAVGGENLSASIIKYTEQRLSNVQSLKPLIDFTSSVNEAILYTSDDYPNFNSYNANQLKEKFENTTIVLSDEEKAKLYFIVSKLYRQLDAKANVHNLYADNSCGLQEGDCLQKVLSLSTDYKLISYCQNRLPRKDSEKNVLRAYKKALTQKQSRGDKYKINRELAKIYMHRSQSIGYINMVSTKYQDAAKAVKYLLETYRYANKEDKLPVLKKMAEIQMRIGKQQDWKNIKEVIALKYLKGQDRCMALISIADKTGDVSFYERALQEAEKGRMKKTDQMEVKEIALTGLVNNCDDEAKKAEAQKQLEAIYALKSDNLYKIIAPYKGKQH